VLNMKNGVAIVFVVGLAVSGVGCAKLQSRDNLNKGVQAYKNARYADAVEYFKHAVELDPSNTNGRLYLATAYMTQYIPGAESPENLKLATAAKQEFMTVLSKDPNDKTALASLASLSYQQAQGMPDLEAKLKKLDESKEWYLKLIASDPQNKEGFYSLGVIDWLKWYPNYQSARAKLGMKPEEPGPLKDKKVKAELKEKYGAVIEDGVKNLQKALDIDPNYDDAMAYMNLIVRERADLADTEDEYKKDIATADAWVQKALDTKKMKAAKAAQSAGSITQESK
jgi:tetratricopeptide (TPR) repeat protein